MKTAEVGYEAYLEYLKSLRNSGASYFLEGGQAVNFWAEYIDNRIEGKPLTPLRPFTSKDCDIWVSYATWEKLKRNPGGQLRKGASPADGQLGIIRLSEDPPRMVDVLSTVYGIPVAEYPKLNERVLDDGVLRVIDPVYLFLSKCHCMLGLDQTARQDERHVRMLSMILPEYLTLLIDDVNIGKLDDRALLKEIKLLRKIASSGICRRAMLKLEIAPEWLLPWISLKSSESEILRRFAQNHQPSEISPS